MRLAPARRPALPRWPYLVALVLALAGLAIRYAPSGRAAPASRLQVLDGVTDRSTSIELVLDRGRVLRLATSLAARCADGSSWKETWTPTNGVQVHVLTAGRSFWTLERAAPSYPGGIVGRLGFAIRGVMTGPKSAQGTIRLVARFYRGEREWNACDSLDVRWAVGPRASARVREVHVGPEVDSYYPAVPSLAVDASPQRRRFINTVDSACVDTYNWRGWMEHVTGVKDSYFDDRELRDAAASVYGHAWELRTLESLGQPPQARGVYDAWLANFRRRVAIEYRALYLLARGERSAAQRELALTVGLKTRGNLLGQRFGLVRCTSDGDRTPVPVLNDGQPRPLL